jgi:hypothetical protein
MMKKICSILLILALVLSFIVVAAPVSAEDRYAALAANITDPVGGQHIMGGDVFTVTANVTNTGNIRAYDVKATIDISGNATLKTGEVATKVLAVEDPPDFAVNETVEVSWDLVCTGGGTVNITVTPSGKDFLTGGLIVNSRIDSDTVSIEQKKVLEVTIVAPTDGYALNITDDFEVTAKVQNVSALNATEVELTISIDRYAELKTDETALREEGDLDAGETSGNHTWTLECTGDGFSRITVTPSGKVGGTAIPADALTPATVTVRQGVFDVANITLAEGWNLISLPLIPLDSDIEVVLAGIMDDVKGVWYWDGSWDSFKPDAPSDLDEMEDGKAYWINMETGRTLYIAGTEMPEGGELPPAYDVVVGWNMVGFKSTAENVTVENYLAGTKYTRIYYFDSGTWFVIPGTAYDTTMMVPGLGYWVAFTEPGTIYPL